MKNTILNRGSIVNIKYIINNAILIIIILLINYSYSYSQQVYDSDSIILSINKKYANASADVYNKESLSKNYVRLDYTDNTNIPKYIIDSLTYGPIKASFINSGFVASTHQDISTGEIVVSFGGTTAGSLGLGDLNDYATDIGLAIGWLGAPTQLAQARAYFLAVKKYADENGLPIAVTGHSLGGALAQYAANGTNVKVVTFNSAPFPFSGNEEPKNTDNWTSIRTSDDPLSKFLNKVIELDTTKSPDMDDLYSIIRVFNEDQIQELISNVDENKDINAGERILLKSWIYSKEKIKDVSFTLKILVEKLIFPAVNGLLKYYLGNGTRNYSELLQGSQYNLNLKGGGHSIKYIDEVVNKIGVLVPPVIDQPLINEDITDENKDDTGEQPTTVYNDWRGLSAASRAYNGGTYYPGRLASTEAGGSQQVPQNGSAFAMLFDQTPVTANRAPNGDHFGIGRFKEVDDSASGRYKHTAWGEWNGSVSIKDRQTGVTHNLSRGLWVIGNVTPTAHMPRSGSASYSGHAIADLLINSPVSGNSLVARGVSGTVNMGVNFGTGNVNGDMTLFRTDTGRYWASNSFNGVRIDNPAFPGHAANSFFGALASGNGDGGSGVVAGYFFGPQPDGAPATWTPPEAGGYWSYSRGDGQTANGVFRVQQ